MGDRISTPEGEAYPRLSNPETAPVISKLADHGNYEVVLNDTELGINYRAEVSQKFFEQSRDFSKLYRQMDIQDKYVYPEELIEAEKFSLGLQVRYFVLGNDRIIEQSDDPESPRIIGLLRSNEQTIISNFNHYLDHFGEEKYFADHAHLLADGLPFISSSLSKHFRRQITTPCLVRRSSC